MPAQGHGRARAHGADQEGVGLGGEGASAPGERHDAPQPQLAAHVRRRRPASISAPMAVPAPAVCGLAQ